MVVLDQVTKAVAARVFPMVSGLSETRPLFGCRWNSAPPVARLGKGRAAGVWVGAGAAFGLFVHDQPHLPWWAGIGAIVAWGGALSNFADFVRWGAVLDFMLIWPRTRGNFADLAVVGGLAVLLIGLIA